ncbi:uncharacterized protein LOC132309621 [Cornus florida]|uniref:uncharacterized protein LOC132309621 n=1 Tax=Cornus florida TaxID=4283 RepID=UPI0028A2A895|nr:uncharacterized protein LOC132309621 [Cornus florida]
MGEVPFHLVVDLFCPQSRGWKVDVLRQLFSPLVVQKILRLHISHWDKSDTLIWAPEQNGSFSVRSAYVLARSFYDQCPVPLTNFSWRSAWRCNTLSKVWKLSPFHLDFSTLSFTSFLDGWHFLLLRANSSPDPSLPLGLIFFCAWYIWKSRTHQVFDGVLWDAAQVVAKAVASFWEFQEARYQCSLVAAPVPSPSAGSWIPPVEGLIKCNFDASFSLTSFRGSGGAMFRDCRGLILHAVVFRPFIASSASMGLVESVQNVSVCPSEIASVCFDIRMDLQFFAVASLKHVRRSANRMAHAIAMLSRLASPIDYELFPIPPQISAFARLDALGLPS